MTIQKIIVEKIDGKYYADGERIDFSPPDKSGWTDEQKIEYRKKTDRLLELAQEIKQKLHHALKVNDHG